MLKSNEVYLGDCLDIMKQIEDQSIDMVLCDLPYGITGLKWDSIIPLDLLWNEYKRIIKPNRAIVLTASQPFTSRLVMSNLKWFKHEWIWEKDNGSNFASLKFMPFKVHESILIFCKKSPLYNPQMIRGKSYQMNEINRKSTILSSISKIKNKINLGDRYPITIQKFNRQRGLHPTQKPVSLFSYLIKTYSNENDLILDNCAGSGTTGIACRETNRQYILIEKDENYYDLCKKRLDKDINLIL